MFCCGCAHAQATEKLFSRFAKAYAWRYRLFGLERSQRQLVEGLARIGYQGSTLLEIGCGVGWLHRWLLQRGAAWAMGVDLSPRMVAEAQRLAAEQGLAERTSYRVGDFVELAAEIEPADCVLLDKVICCYPDAAALLRQAASRARRAVALTYPRRHRLNRALHGGLNRLLIWMRSDFRTYLHDPAAVEELFYAWGWKKDFEARTWLWLTQVFVREPR
ncbi:hypothetical protein JCM13664_02560 [Methylothermus subterraneus]